MFKIIKIEVTGYKQYMYKIFFECSDKNYIIERFGINERECDELNGVNTISVDVDKTKLIYILNQLEDIKEKRVFNKLLSFRNNKYNDMDNKIKHDDYKFLLNYYKLEIINDFVDKYNATDKQVDYVENVLKETDIKLYKDVISDLVEVFGLKEVESELLETLADLGINFNINNLSDDTKKLMLKVLKVNMFSNKFIYVIFSSSYSYEYLKTIFDFILNKDIKGKLDFESFIIKLAYDCFNVDNYFYTKFEKELKEYLDED